MLGSLLRLLRPSEYVVLGYFLYASLVAALRPIAPGIRETACLLNLTVIAAYALLAYADSFRHRKFLGVLRDWFPLALLLLAYREMGWFALPHSNTRLEEGWVVWDHLVLQQWGASRIIEALGPVVPSILEIAYSLVYTTTPFSLAALYLLGRRHEADEFLFPALLGVLGCYALFPYFPSEPPRTIFPDADVPLMTPFRMFNHWLLGNYGIHTSVFPSAHVSGAFSCAFALRRLLYRHVVLTRGMLVLAILIATATVYGRYHYLVDALAGFAVALLSARLTSLVYGSAE